MYQETSTLKTNAGMRKKYQKLFFNKSQIWKRQTKERMNHIPDAYKLLQSEIHEFSKIQKLENSRIKKIRYT